VGVQGTCYSVPLVHVQKTQSESCRGDSGLPSVCTSQCLHARINYLFDLNDLRSQAIYTVIIVASCDMKGCTCAPWNELDISQS